MKKSLQATFTRVLLLQLVFFLYQNHVTFAQDMVFAQVSADDATSPLLAGAANQVVLGFTVTRTGVNTATNFNNLTISTGSTDPNSVFSSVALYKNTANTGFANASVIGTATSTLNPTSITFANVTYHAFPSGAGGTDVAVYFYVVATVKPDVATTVAGVPSIQLSFTQANVGFSALTAANFSISGTTYSFQGLEATIGSLNSAAVNKVATSPLVGGTTGAAIFGFSLTSSISQTVSEIYIKLTSDPAGILSSYSLVSSTDADFSTAGDNTTIAGGITFTFPNNTTELRIGNLNQALTTTPKNYFLVANVSGAVTGATPSIQASLDPANTNSLTLNAGTKIGSATGINYSFAALSTTIASLNVPATHKVATSPIASGTNGVSIFGFSLTSSGIQTASEIFIQFTSNPSGIFSSYSLVSSTDTDFSTTGDNTTIASGITFSFPNTPNELRIGNLTQALTTTSRNYFLVANVDPGVTVATPAIQASLSAANANNITLNAGSRTGSATGINYSFAPLTATIASLNSVAVNKVAPSPIAGGTNGVAVFGFSLASNGNQTVSEIYLQLSNNPAGILSGYSLVASTDADFSTSGDNTTVAGGITFGFPNSPTELRIGNLTQAITSTPKHYFLVANVSGAVNVGTTPIQVSLDAAATNSLTVSGGAKTGSATGISYSFAPLSMTIGSLNTLANNVAISPLQGTSAVVGRPIFGFSLTSNGSQTVSEIFIQLTNDPDGIFQTYSLVRSTDTDFATGGNNTTIAGGITFTFPNSPTELRIGNLAEVITSTGGNFFLVADVTGTVTTTTSDIQASLDAANTNHVGVNDGSVTGSASGNTYLFTQSFASDIILQGGTTSQIAYTSFQTPSNLTSGGSASLGNFRIRDGGASADADGIGTTLTDLSISISNSTNVRTVAIFDGTTRLAELPVAPTLNFTGLALTATDGGTKDFIIRATFQQVVVDNQVIQVTITSATASAAGSGFATGNAGGATTGGSANDIEVTATRLVFVNPASLPPLNPIFTGTVNATLAGQPGSTFNLTVAAVDGNTNIDLDNSAAVTINTTPTINPGGDFTGNTGSLVNGLRTYAMTIAQPNTYTMGATATGLTAASSGNSTSCTVEIQSLGVSISEATLDACQVGSANIFTALPNLVLTEIANSDFSVGTNVTFLLILPSGWEFLRPSTSSPTPAYSAPSISYTPGRNFTAATFETFVSPTIAQFKYTVNGTNQSDALTISGLFVKNIDGVVTGNLYRSGTGIIAGVNETKVLGVLTTGGAPTADFIVESSPGQAPIQPNEINFSVFSAPILLKGEVPDNTPISGGTFSGQAVSFKFVGNPINENRWQFNPSSLNEGLYPVTFSYTDPGTGCISSKTKEFNVFANAITGLQNEYCASDNAVKNISVNPGLVPSWGTATGKFGLYYPSYQQIADVINNNNGTVTLFQPGHGLLSGNTYYIEAYYGFSGPDAPFGYISNNFVISNVTENSFDINANVTGTWDRVGAYIYLENPPVQSVTNFGTYLRFTVNNHGFLNGAKPYIYVDGISLDGGLNYYFYGYYTVSNVTTNTFDVAVSFALGFSSYSYVSIYEYEISSFYPTIGTSLNSNIARASNYYVYYFVTENGCSFPYGCTYGVNYTPVNLNPLPAVDFNILNPTYCSSDNAPITLTGLGNLDGTYSINPIGGLNDAGPGANTATFLPSAAVPDTPIDITYAVVDAKGCANSITKPTIVFSPPIVSAGPDLTICNDGGVTSVANIGGTPTATGNAPFQFNWTPVPSLDNPGGPNPRATPTANTSYTVNVTDRFGCEGSDVMQVTVNAPATVEIGPEAISICSATPLDLRTIPGIVVGGTATQADWGLSDLGSGTGNFENDDEPRQPDYDYLTSVWFTPTPTDITNGGVVIRLTTNDPDGVSGPCPAATEDLKITINANPPPPSISPTGPKSGPSIEYYCVTPGSAGATAPIQANGSGIKWYNNDQYLNAASVNPFATGITTLSPTSAVFYATQTVNGCESVWASDTIVVNPAPFPDFDIVNLCEGDTTLFTDLSTLSAGTIDLYRWDFKDATIIGPGLVNTIIVGSGNTNGTFNNPGHKFGTVGIFDVSLTVTTSEGCSNTINSFQTTFGAGNGNNPLRIGKVPIANFAYSEICEGDVTQFDYLEGQNPAADDMKTYEWDFGDVASPSNTSLVADPTHLFTEFKTYYVYLKLTSNLDCIDEITKPVAILPYITDFTNPYIESFEDANHGWSHEGFAFDFKSQSVPDSWNLITPSGPVINSAYDGTKAWMTRAGFTYSDNERSVLNGPCIDVRELDRPALSFAYWNQVQPGQDGVYLETSVDGGASWQVLGDTQTGLRWYKQSSVSGLVSQTNVVNGGTIGQALNQYGFSEKTTGWLNGKYSLDGFATQPKLRIRFVFGSNGDNPPGEVLEGFAMDYFKLETRSKVLLAENFTNTNELQNNADFFTYKQGITNTEVIKIQYHTTLKGADAINAQNPSDPNARVAFYGITNTDDLIPRAYIDGFSQGNYSLPLVNSLPWVESYSSLRSLEDAFFKLSVSTVPTTAGTIKVAGSIEALQNIPSSTRPVAFIAIVEKVVGNNHYVLRKMLPSAAGYPLAPTNTIINQGQVFTLPATESFEWQIDNPAVDQNNLAVVLFVQDYEHNAEGYKPVYQAAITLSPTITPAVVTGLEDPAFAEKIQVYPNPANEEVHVELPAPVVNATPIRLMDAQGRLVFDGSFESGEYRKTIDTSSFAGGVYILQIQSNETKVWRKVLIAHQGN